MAIRKIGLVSRTYRHVNRYRQILAVLFRYGFDDLIDRLHISHYLEIGLDLISRRTHEHVARMTTAERTRVVLEELGPTFIKLGQVLSTRPDLIPLDIAEELTKLQQEVPPFPFEDAKRIVETELGRPLEDVFPEFEEKSVAAASIGQVHRARLPNGDDVVVKVQRPDILAVIEVDLEILLHLATLVERHIEGGRVQRPTRIVEEFTRVIEQELDYTIEAAHLERFAALFNTDETVYVPKVYRNLTTTRVLTMERIDGIPIREVSALRSAGIDLQTVAQRGATLTLKQVFTFGFFHADPHPGNVFVLPGEVICLLDFGMMGRLDRRTREMFADLIHAVATRDSVRATRALLRLTEHDDDTQVDIRALERDTAEFIDVHVVSEIQNLNMGAMLDGMLGLLGRHKLRIPPDLVMVLRALTIVEKQATRLDPALNMITASKRYIRRLKVDRLRPARLVREVYDAGADMLQLALEIPGNVRDLLRLASRGSLKVNFEHRGLESFIDANERIANRVSFAIVVAALIVGSSLIVHSRIPPHWHEIPVIGLVGYVAAGIMGFLLLWSILRHGRM